MFVYTAPLDETRKAAVVLYSFSDTYMCHSNLQCLKRGKKCLTEDTNRYTVTILGDIQTLWQIPLAQWDLRGNH